MSGFPAKLWIYKRTFTISLIMSDYEDTPEKPFDPLQYPIRLIGAQLAVATALGISAVVTFSILRKKYPQLYEARRARRRRLKTPLDLIWLWRIQLTTVFYFCYFHFHFFIDDLPELSKTMFGWIWSLYKITDEQVLEHAGLDAFVVGTTAVYL